MADDNTIKVIFTNIFDLLNFMEVWKKYPLLMKDLHLAIVSEDWDKANNVIRELKTKYAGF